MPSKKVSDDDLYRRSTQYRYWSFTPSKLEDLRILANKKGLGATQKRLEAMDQSTEEAVLIKGKETFPYVSVEEEFLIVTYYARKCRDLANFFHLPSQARSTAIMYLYKFYLTNSAMCYDPQRIMYTCLFLAAKVENSFIGIASFSKAIPRTTPDSILQYEYLIVQSMRFSLRCHHPYQSLYGFYLDIQSLFPKLDLKRLGDSCDKARETVGESLFTDAVFLYTPPQIALAALWKADDALVEKYLNKKFKDAEPVPEPTPKSDDEANAEEGTGDDEHTGQTPTEFTALPPNERYDLIYKTIQDCAKALDVALNPSVDDAKRVASKVHFCLEPIKYGRRLAKQSRAAAESVVEAQKRPADSEELETKRAKAV